MREMKWSWPDYLALPDYHRHVLLDILEEESRQARLRQLEAGL